MEPFIDKSGYSPETEEESRGMGAAEWVQSHIYTTVCVGAGVLLIFGALVVKQRIPAPSSGTIQAWGGGGTLVNPVPYDPQNPVLANLSASTFDNSASISITPIPVSNAASSSTSDSFDIRGFIASLGLGAGPNTAPSSAPASGGITTRPSYDFIPQGLISVPTSGRTRTALQQALYTWGNDAGSYIQSYESGHRNTAPALRDQAADRQNKQKGQAVKDIGTALTNVGLSLQNMDSVPPSMQAMNQVLASSYIDIGHKLGAIPDAPGDDTFITAIKTYDAAVETFIKNYVAVAQYLSLSGVTFSSTDPGSVFTFSGGGAI